MKSQPANRSQNQLVSLAITTVAVMALTLFVGLTAWSGCNNQPAITSENWVAVDVEAATDLLYDTNGDLVKEDWYQHRIDEHKVGHRWVRVYQVDEGSGRGTRRLVIDKLAIPRFKSVTHQTLRTVTLTNESGVQKMAYELDSGRKQRVAAQVIGDKLRIKRIGGASTDFDWSSSIQGFGGVEQSLAASPMKPGETRTVSVFQAINDNVVTYELTAGNWQPLETLAGSAEVMPVVAKPRGGDELSETLTYWLDRQSSLIRRDSSFLKQTLDRCNELQAMSINDPIDFDLALAASVPLPQPIDRPAELRSARYRVTCQGINPEKLFPTCAYQTVTPISDNVAEITVAEIAVAENTVAENTVAENKTPQKNPNPESRIPDSPRPTRSDIQSNRWLQTTHKTITSFAETAAGEETEPLATARAIREYVYGYLDKSESDQVLATALVAATERKGDCTEHAMLVASACRALKIPARVAIGLIYDEPSESMVYHMWTEVWARNTWLPLDATRPHPHFVATRIKMSDEDLNNVSDFGIVAPVIRAAGKVEIELLEAD